MHWFIDPIKNHYANFEGRVGRQEFWMFILFSVGLNIALNILKIDVLALLVSLALFVPSIALTARRLHDTGKSGWWQLLWLIPIVGWIIIVVFCAQETTSADNQFGTPAKPKVPGIVASVVPLTTPAAAAPVATDATVLPDSEIVADKTPQ